MLNVSLDYKLDFELKARISLVMSKISGFAAREAIAKQVPKVDFFIT